MDFAVVAVNVKVLFLLHSVEMAEIFIKQEEEGKFLDITRVPAQLKLRSGLENYLYIRDCYEVIIANIVESLSLKHKKTVAILGTAGIGTSSLFLIVLKLLIEDPTKFGLSTRSHSTFRLYLVKFGYTVMCMRMISVSINARNWMYQFLCLLTWRLNRYLKSTLAFPSSLAHSCASRYHELTKQGWRKVMPTWSADEQADLFSSAQFQSEHGKEVAQRAYENILYFGGSIGNNIELAITGRNPKINIDDAIINKGEYVCERFFNIGVASTGDVSLNFLVHRNPVMTGDVHDFDAEAGAFSFASPYVLRRLLALNNNMPVSDARNKYAVGTFRGGDDGSEFALLCLHGFKISDVEFHAQPLTDNAQPTKLKFPPKQVLALNWRQRENYLEANMLYIPPYGNVESGDGFCLMEINGRWTVVIIQCTIAENHPVKQRSSMIAT